MHKPPMLLLPCLAALSILAVSAHFPPPPPSPMPISASEGIACSYAANELLISDPGSSLDPLQVHFINVGKGDAILIDLGKTEILIDGGRELPGIVDYLSHYVDGPLEIVIATHPHDDHIGGLVEVLAEFHVGQIWHSGEEINRRLCREFMKAIEVEGAETFVARLGDTIEVEGLVFRVLNPANLDGSTNDNSIVLMFSYGTIDFLFAADAEKAAERHMLEQSIFPVEQVEILKVGHHGLTASSSPEFLHTVQPVVAVVMSNHPENKPTLSALKEMGADVFVTSVNGTIVIDTDGHEFIVRCER